MVLPVFPDPFPETLLEVHLSRIDVLRDLPSASLRLRKSMPPPLRFETIPCYPKYSFRNRCRCSYFLRLVLVGRASLPAITIRLQAGGQGRPPYCYVFSSTLLVRMS